MMGDHGKAPEELVEEARRLDREDDLEGAERAFSGLVESYPEDVTVQLACGTVLFRLKRYAEAVPHLERVVQSRPCNQWASLCLFHSLFKSGRWEDAANEVMRFGNAGGESMEYRRIVRDIRASELAGDKSGQSTSKWWILLRNEIYELKMDLDAFVLPREE